MQRILLCQIAEGLKCWKVTFYLGKGGRRFNFSERGGQNPVKKKVLRLSPRNVFVKISGQKQRWQSLTDHFWQICGTAQAFEICCSCSKQMTPSSAQDLVVVFRSKVFWLQVSEFVVFQKLAKILMILLKFIEIPVKPSLSYYWVTVIFWFGIPRSDGVSKNWVALKTRPCTLAQDERRLNLHIPIHYWGSISSHFHVHSLTEGWKTLSDIFWDLDAGGDYFLEILTRPWVR